MLVICYLVEYNETSKCTEQIPELVETYSIISFNASHKSKVMSQTVITLPYEMLLI